MFVHGKTTGWPVPGVTFDGRQLFVQVQVGDKEEDLAKFAVIACCALKMFADVLAAPNTPHHRLEQVNLWLKRFAETGVQADYVKEVDRTQLQRKIIDG